MKSSPYKTGYLLIILLAYIGISGYVSKDDDKFLEYKVNTHKSSIRFYWKDNNNNLLRNFDNLNRFVSGKNQQLIFAMNGGMYQANNTPLGLYIENGKTITPINKRSGNGNFYLKPNGIFSIDENGNAAITPTEKFGTLSHIKWATQSGPMLVSDGNIHTEFKPNSVNTNIRNGVGILPNGELLFVMSKKPVNFYAFASYFKSAGCRQALYLDGFVSRTYLPVKNWVQTDGNFGVMIGETVAK